MAALNAIVDVHTNAQRRGPAQSTVFTRGLRPLMKNTFLYHDYAYGWVPGTAAWGSRHAELDITDFLPISIELLSKFEFMISLIKRRPVVYEPRIANEFISHGAINVRLCDVIQRFAILPTNEYISFLLLTSMPIYNILYLFPNTVFDVQKHTLFSDVYTSKARHIELARYIRAGGDFKPLFSRLGDNNLDNCGSVPGTLARANVPLSRFESLSNLSAILYFTNYDPVLMFLTFYIPNFSVTTSITPAVEYLMTRLGLTVENVTII